MFREMRLKKQQLPEDEAIAILKKRSNGVLGVIGDDGYPYTVPVSYVYTDGKICFHCAPKGHKFDAIKACNKVSFCVVDKDKVVQEDYTSYFRSVIAFGRARVMEPEEMKVMMKKLVEKYCPDMESDHMRHIRENANPKAMAGIEITIEHMTGKKAAEK